MAEHVGMNTFSVKDLTIHRRGTIASFVRRIEEALGFLRAFFHRTNHDYTRLNYIGEWHSHPCFEPEPSLKDDASMREIVGDATIGANFVVLLIVKLSPDGVLITSVHSYLPNGDRIPASLRLVG
jgi:[CysO sulfur-carrier protein]-S-L-cysteine hydrolase